MDMTDEHPTLNWTVVTPRGVVQVRFDGTVFLVDGVFIPVERYAEAIRTGVR
jgi:hypothetical protein